MRPHWSATELAERLDITPRTVRRDVTRLRELGYPVSAEPGPQGGYQLGAGGALPPLLLSDDEAVAVATGLRATANSGVAAFEEAAIAALAKLEQVLPTRLRHRVDALNATIVLPRRRQEVAATDPDVLLTLAQACRGPERLRFHYRDAAGRDSERRLEPYRLVNTARRWYLLARDLDRAAWRTFRVDRVSEPVLTGHRFTHAEEPDAAALVSQAIAVAPYRWQAEVLLHADLAEAEAEVSPVVGTLDPVPGDPTKTLLRIGANELEYIARYLVSLELSYEVRDPPELRKALRALGRQLLRQHPR